jgi:hypothetical protein
VADQGANNGAGQAAGKSFVSFSRPAAQRIAKAVRTVEAGDRNQPGLTFDHPMPSMSFALKLGKTTASWTKGTLATIALYGAGTPPSETTSSATLANCVNKFATVASGKWVMLGKAANGSWYLISAECS